MEINTLYKYALKGNRTAEKELFESLYVRFGVIVHQRIRQKNDADDIVQEALMIVADNFKDIIIRKSFSAWAVKVLDNRILAYYKQRQISQGRLSDSPLEEYSMVGEKQNTTLRRQLLMCLKRLLKANINYARILNMHYQGFTHDEICQRLKITSNNAYASLSRARKMLVKCLKDHGEVIR